MLVHAVVFFPSEWVESERSPAQRR